MYADDDRFRQTIAPTDDTVAEYLRDAMTLYADTNLSD